jgi:hypothetical protein
MLLSPTSHPPLNAAATLAPASLPTRQASSPTAGNQGSRLVPYQKHQDKDQSGGTSSGGPVYYNTITAMPQYLSKSVEELRWEDYQAGVKNGASAPPAAAGGFGAPAPASQPAFGGFGGASPAPAFGAAAAPAANPFGAAPSATPAFGGGFGAASSESWVIRPLVGVSCVTAAIYPAHIARNIPLAPQSPFPDPHQTTIPATSPGLWRPGQQPLWLQHPGVWRRQHAVIRRVWRRVDPGLWRRQLPGLPLWRARQQRGRRLWLWRRRDAWVWRGQQHARLWSSW